MLWYKVRGYQAHAGIRKCREILLYIKANDPVHALIRYQRVPSIKKNLHGQGRFPDIVEATLEETKTIEEKIRRNKRSKNKERCWFYMPRKMKIS
jgi:hypothetical protein